MGSADEVMASAGATLARRREELSGSLAADVDAKRRARAAARARAKRTAAAIGIANLVILVAAVAIGLAVPIGLFGALGVMLLMLLVTIAIAMLPGRAVRASAAETLRTVDLKALPAQTERWLAAQRPALPAPARTLVDQIGLRLGALGPQLAALDPGAPAGEDVRQLVAEQLPEFVRGYQRVPADLRAAPRNGRTPDAQLVDGLTLIDRQLSEMSANLAQGDLDALATRGRYLEIKYQGEGESG